MSWSVYWLKTEDGWYFGSTSDVYKRINAHKNAHRTGNHKFETFEVLRDGLTEEEAKQYEDELIHMLPCINVNGAYGVDYERRKLGRKRYALEHKDEINAYHNEYYSKNKDKYAGYRNRLREGEMMMFGRTKCSLFRKWFRV